MSIGPGTSSTDRYALTPSTDDSCGLIGTARWPSARNARMALLPNLLLSLEAPITATVLGMWPLSQRTIDALALAAHDTSPHLLLHLLPRPREPGDHRLRRGVLRRGVAR